MKNPPISEPFWQLWQSHQEHLLTQSLRLMGGNPDDARDALHVAMLRAYTHFLEQDRALVNARAWLSRILHNVCMDFHRERRRFTERSMEEQPEGMEEDVSPSEVRTTEELLIENERVREVRACIQTLPPPLREPLAMRFLQDMSYPDIAERLRLTNSNVRKRVQLAYGLLRIRLAHLHVSREV